MFGIIESRRFHAEFKLLISSLNFSEYIAAESISNRSDHILNTIFVN